MLEFFAGRRYDVDNAKAKRELGIEHRPLKEGLREYLAWEIERLATEGEEIRGSARSGLVDRVS